MPMQHHDATATYRRLYEVLLRLSPRSFRERFGEGMRQTFNDLLRERSREGRGMIAYALWMCAETSVQILRMNITSFAMKNKRIVGIICAIIGLLLIPFIASQITDEMQWTGSDYFLMGIMLTIAGTLFEVGARFSTSTPYRVGLATAVATGVVLLWLSAAVGIIGPENNPKNELYAGVLLIGFIGALLSMFKARGLAIAALVTAIAQFLVPILALIIYPPDITSGEGPSMIGVFILNSFFVGLWLVAARLFKQAAETEGAAPVPQS
jgi:hypothetical protein